MHRSALNQSPGDRLIGGRLHLASDTLRGLLHYIRVCTHRSSVVRFGAMASIKNPIADATFLLGCFLLTCTLIYLVANRHHYSREGYKYIRVNKITGTVEIMGVSGISGREYEWVRFKHK